MKITRYPYITKKESKLMSLESFADQHNLTMVIRERDPHRVNLKRYYACFEYTEAKGDGVLISLCGDGDTEREAMVNYAKQIAGTTLVIHAYTDERKEIKVPETLTISQEYV